MDEEEEDSLGDTEKVDFSLTCVMIRHISFLLFTVSAPMSKKKEVKLPIEELPSTSTKSRQKRKYGFTYHHCCSFSFSSVELMHASLVIHHTGSLCSVLVVSFLFWYLHSHGP